VQKWKFEATLLLAKIRVLRGCIAIIKTAPIGVFVIPGLTRNPAHLQGDAPLDAGSSPA